MSDQQPTPETPRDPQSGPTEGGLDPAASAAAGGPGVGDSAPSTAQQPPTWPAHAAPPGQPAAQPGGQQPPAYPAPYPPEGGYPPPGYPPAPGYPPYGYAPAPTTSTSAIVGLVLAIASWIVCPIVLAIVALVLAKKSNDEIAASQGRVGGEGLNTATKVVAWINIGLYAAIFVIIGAIFLIALVAGALSGS